MGDIILVAPEKIHEDAVLDYINEHHSFGERKMSGSGGLHRADTFDEWLSKVNEYPKHGETDGAVPATTLLAFRTADGRLIGTVQIRHRLNDHLLKIDGHIGGGVRPTERRKGYATQMLKMALEKCRELGIDKVLVTCNKANVASASVIQKCGGIYENEIVEDNGNTVQRYWIKP